MDHFRFWKESLHLASDDHGVADYEASMRMLEMLACWDCVDVPNLAGIELAMRRAQMYEYLYVMESTDPGPAPVVEPPAEGDKQKKKGRGRGGGGKGLLRFGFVDEGAIFTGTSRDHGHSMVCPTLLEHVGKEIEREVTVLKQVRKAREERRAFRQ